MKEFASFMLNAFGSLSASIVLLIIVLRAFGAPFVYNDAFVALALFGITWIVLVGYQLRK